MLDLNTIAETITELENSDTTFATCERLAALYTVLEHFDIHADSVQKELTDILPQYQTYRQVKRKYQFGEVTATAVISAMRDTCKEISEFVQMLYSSTDMEEERQEIKKLVHTLNSKY